ncbi:DegT/DnrJ/EryC1/StrS family aminotransferase [Thalassomonas viridans]|uniref:DegT/DnrJ/EryC1/StrS family aminotransferase n=1 Tax=Thalassomonas viridans TaxID=137584 RepID=A0AAE9Z956_9GAMM|nr:DegT/DnrJ/EryC1/StrS family aminotransferase [Thalassomonas viridans]WDE08991.1 DegT/DnrJ/EryC1/StrS family aminotransferase [Thalassomonas viridans]
MNKVDFYRTGESFGQIKAELYQQLSEALSRETIVNGEAVAKFEQAMQEYTGASHCIAVGNGTDALIMLLTAAGIGKGDEVIIPSYSFFASLSCVLHVGATPVFVDIEQDSYAIDAAKIEEKITSKTKAIMPVHLFTQLADMQAITAIAKRHSLEVFEDSAEGFGMFADGRHAGLFGKGGVLSFFPTKTLGALGDAGMIVTNDADLAGQCRLLRNLGRDEEGIAQILGVNSRMDDLHACFMLARMGRMEEEIAARKWVAGQYHERLAALFPRVKLPVIVERPGGNHPVYYVYQIAAENRDALAAYLTEKGIVTETYYPMPLHQQPCIADLDYRAGDMPVAEMMSESAIALPLYPDMSAGQISYVCNAIKDFYNQ